MWWTPPHSALLTTRALSEQYEEQLQERAAFHGADRSEAGC